uniref:KH_dom_type_1 domain-containing protein n=1 Tax=Meloidogyne hapla TaxID=6305 RepID=A0A1I8B238_MELHA
MPPSTPSQRRPQQKFNSPNADTFRSSPRSGLMNKLNIDPKNVDCLQLCMDVPFLDHPYLIGPRGRKSQVLFIMLWFWVPSPVCKLL